MRWRLLVYRTLISPMLACILDKFSARTLTHLHLHQERANQRSRCSPTQSVCEPKRRLRMRIVLKALAMVGAFAVLTLSVCLCWLYFYSADLPDFASLTRFAPELPATVSDQCSSSPVHVIPSASIGNNLQIA